MSIRCCNAIGSATTNKQWRIQGGRRGRAPPLGPTCFITARNEVGARLFLQASVILSTGGGVPDQVHPQDQVHPPTRYTPRDQVHPRPGTPPRTRYTPPGLGTPPMGPGTPPSLPGPGTPPGTRYTPRHRACWEIRSTRGRYASYRNAILFSCIFGKNFAK